MMAARARCWFLVAQLVGVTASACSATSDSAPGGGGAGLGGGGSTDTTGVETSSSSTDTGAPSLGLACVDGDPCGEDGFCLLPTDDVLVLGQFFGRATPGGPAGGYCSQRCGGNDECPGAGSVCFDPGANGFCLLGCAFGEPPLASLDEPLAADKCQGRDDLMCTPTASGAAVCAPACGSDSECTAGRGCDLGVGLCVEAPRQGAALGTACQPDAPTTPADDDPCAGSCLTLVDVSAQPVAHVCSARCSLGGPQLDSANCGGPLVGLCAYDPWLGGVSEAGLGDAGYCAAACEAHDGCNYLEGMFCADLGVFAAVGKGYCQRATACPTSTECSDAELCIETAFGPVCLDADPASPTELLLPLGSAAGGAGGAGGSSG